MKAFVTVHVITYNEEKIIHSFISHYRKIFPDCIIKIYDNYSTDNTVEIAKSMNCEIHYYDSEGVLNDSKFLDIKNNCWKTADTDWVVVCDADEFIQITQEELQYEEKIGFNIIKFIGYTMMNKGEEIPVEDMIYGFRDLSYDKYYLFNKKYITEINYNYGCHAVNGGTPNTIHRRLNIGSSKEYRAFHYKYLGLEYSINRRKMMSKRVSDFNKSRNFTLEYTMTEEQLKNDNNLNHLSIEKIYNTTELQIVRNK